MRARDLTDDTSMNHVHRAQGFKEVCELRLNTLNCSSCRQLYYALIRASGDGPLQQCRCFSFLYKSKRWCKCVPFIATSAFFSKITIALGAGRIPVGTRVQSSKQQGHTGDDAATASQHIWCRPAYGMAVQGDVLL